MKKSSFLIKILIMSAVFIGIFLITNYVYAGSITLNNLNFEIQLNEDGSMDVIENWDAKITNTNTMFKNFKLDSSKFKEITNVEVYLVKPNNIKQKLTKINKEMYHVTRDCYYGLVNSNGDFEIAWGVSVDDTETRNYQIKYTVLDAIKTYEDCSELYWQLVGVENTIPVNKLTATINLPKVVTDKNNIRGWAHGPYNGNIAVYPDKIFVEVENLDTETMVEVRVVTLENLFQNNKIINENKFDTILYEEGKWAEEANRKREEQKNRERVLIISAIIGNVALSIVFIIILIKNSVKAKKTEKKTIPYIEYFRDIPDEDASAGDAAFLYYFKTGNFSANLSKVLSATLLQLSLKKYIAFSIDETKAKPDIRINILDYSDHIEQMPGLKEDEQIVYELLKKVSKENTFTMKEFKKYAEKHSETFVKETSKIEKVVKKQQEKINNYSEKEASKASNNIAYGVLFIIFGIILTMFLPVAGVIMILNCIPHFIIYNKTYNLTDKGMEEKTKWQGLKKYMEDFSLLNEKEVPDLVLWEKYLVFATAFGIADKVLKQLKIKYPDLQQIAGYEYSYMNLLYYNALNTSFLNSLDTSVNKVYMGAIGNSSSSGGYGGGFSGGGGFGGGGGRNGRKII